MRRKLIVSLLPGATEMVAAIGGEEQLVGISHECDWPPSVPRVMRVTTTPIDQLRSSGEIDRAVREAVAEGRAVIAVDAATIRALRPDVIITQQLCDVCAVADGEVHQLATALDQPVEIVVLSGTTIGGMLDDIETIGRAIGREHEAAAVTRQLRAEIAALAKSAPANPLRVVAIEWLDPPFLAGHWVPEMIAAAGGVDIGATAGSHSIAHTWEEIVRLDPDVVLIALCGFDETRARIELEQLRNPIARAWLGARQVAVLDGNAYTSRPGPRVVEGIRRMREGLECET